MILCPRCGTPARVAIVLKASVRYELDAHGKIGRVLSTSRNTPEPYAYECGGGHVWETEPTAEDTRPRKKASAK
jgi:hypothetical protein